MFIIIAGPSGVGKNTVIEEILTRVPSIKYLQSCTTRPKRDVEINKTGYIYLDFKSIEEMIQNGELFEYEIIHGNLYGTLSKSISDVIHGPFDYIKDLGVLGQKYFVDKLKGQVKILSFYLTSPKDVIEKRLIERGEKEVQKRLERFDFEESHKGNFDYIIDNENLYETVEFIISKIEEAKKK